MACDILLTASPSCCKVIVKTCYQQACYKLFQQVIQNGHPTLHARYRDHIIIHMTHTRTTQATISDTIIGPIAQNIQLTPSPIFNVTHVLSNFSSNGYGQ